MPRKSAVKITNRRAADPQLTRGPAHPFTSKPLLVDTPIAPKQIRESDQIKPGGRVRISNPKGAA